MHSTFSLAMLETIIFMCCEFHFWPTPPHRSLLLHLSCTGLIFPSLSLCPPVWVHLLTGMQIRIYTAVNKQKKFTLRMGWGGMVVYFQGTKALAVPLVTNTSILRLNLRDNWMEGMGGAAIAEMLKGNCYITGGFTVIYCGLNTLCSFFLYTS